MLFIASIIQTYKKIGHEITLIIEYNMLLRQKQSKQFIILHLYLSNKIFTICIWTNYIQDNFFLSNCFPFIRYKNISYVFTLKSK